MAANEPRRHHSIVCHLSVFPALRHRGLDDVLHLVGASGLSMMKLLRGLAVPLCMIDPVVAWGRGPGHLHAIVVESAAQRPG